MSYLRDVPLSHSGGTVSGEAEHVMRAIAIDRELSTERSALVAELRGRGVKAAHPDDGWVNRERNRIHLAYPYFNDGIDVGDLLALDHWHDGIRLVRVVGFSENRVACMTPGWERWYLYFEPVVALDEEREPAGEGS